MLHKENRHSQGSDVSEVGVILRLQVHLRQEIVLRLPAAKKATVSDTRLQPQGQGQDACPDSGMSAIGLDD